MSARATSPKTAILVSTEPVDARSTMDHRAQAEMLDRAKGAMLKALIPSLFKIPIQGAVGGHIVARETIFRSARTSPPSATAATSRGSASC